MHSPLRLGTRGSALALVQARWVAIQLERLGETVALEVIRTTGDRMSARDAVSGDGKGVFVAELEQALLQGHIDLAVHSMKDLPGAMTTGLTLAAVPAREDPRDVLITINGSTPILAALPDGALVGTSSPRRRAQLLAARPQLTIVELHGNIDTRIRKLDAGDFDAICIAAAGMHRLGLAARITEYLDTASMLPAAGQGALAVQTRSGDQRLLARCAPLHHEPTAQAVRAERAVLAALGGGCNLPLGVLATDSGDAITIHAALCSPDGNHIIREQLTASTSPEVLGALIAEKLRHRSEENGNGI